jgi:hypothetical protein
LALIVVANSARHIHFDKWPAIKELGYNVANFSILQKKFGSNKSTFEEMMNKAAML